jgi:hypothetical protein
MLVGLLPIAVNELPANISNPSNFLILALALMERTTIVLLNNLFRKTLEVFALLAACH